MDIFNGLLMLMDLSLLVVVIIGLLVGIIVGILPGLNGAMVLGLAIPFTFSMEPIEALLLILSIHFASVYGGAITGILINTPGTPAGAAAALDGYPLTQMGQSRKALQMSAISAFFGAMMSVTALAIFAPLLSDLAIKLGPQEYFALGIFGLSVVSGVAGRSLVKGLIAGFLGLMISVIGVDPINAAPRFTFGNEHLYDGIELVSALIGLFALSQIFIQFSMADENNHLKRNIKVIGDNLTLKEFKRGIKTMFKGGFIGCLIGAMPGTGGVIASFFSYNEAKRSSKNPEKFGKGELNGIAAAESGAVGTESTALIPLLTLGIPGDVAAAIVLGVMIMHGVHVGPQLFEQSGDLVAALFIGIVILEALVLFMGWYGSALLARIVKIPRPYLYSGISVLIATGAFTLTNDMFNVYVTLCFGVLGYLMLKFEYPIPPMLLGLILGPIIEDNLMLSLTMTGGNWGEVFLRPGTLIILLLALFSMIASIRIQLKIQKFQNKYAAADKQGEGKEV